MAPERLRVVLAVEASGIVHEAQGVRVHAIKRHEQLARAHSAAAAAGALGAATRAVSIGPVGLRAPRRTPLRRRVARGRGGGAMPLPAGFADVDINCSIVMPIVPIVSIVRRDVATESRAVPAAGASAIGVRRDGRARAVLRDGRRLLQDSAQAVEFDARHEARAAVQRVVVVRPVEAEVNPMREVVVVRLRRT